MTHDGQTLRTFPSQDMTQISEDTQGGVLYRVAVRLPSFWPDRPALWFAQAEAQFEVASITRQKTKFSYVVSQLHQQHAAEVEDIITSPPEEEPYDRLKAELVRRLSTSREQRVRQLFSHEEKGDRKPSQFLRHQKALAPDVPDDFLRTIWASRLPPHVQAILAGQTEGSLDSASQLADRICEVAPQPVTASVTPAPYTPDNTALWSAFRSCHIRWPPSEPLLTVSAQNPENIIAARTAAHLPVTTYGGITGHLGTKPKSAHTRVPAARETQTADVNGG